LERVTGAKKQRARKKKVVLTRVGCREEKNPYTNQVGERKKKVYLGWGGGKNGPQTLKKEDSPKKILIGESVELPQTKS